MDAGQVDLNITVKNSSYLEVDLLCGLLLSRLVLDPFALLKEEKRAGGTGPPSSPSTMEFAQDSLNSCKTIVRWKTWVEVYLF